MQDAELAAREAAAPGLADFCGGMTLPAFIIAVLIGLAIYGFLTYVVMVVQES